MSLCLGLRRVSQSFNALIRHRSLAHRHFTTQSCSRRVLFFVRNLGNGYFYSAKIQKDGTLGPATMLPSVPSEILPEILSSESYVTNDKILFLLGWKLHIYRPDTGEYSTLADLPPRHPALHYKYFNSVYYFGFDALSNEHEHEHKVLLVQSVYYGEALWKRLFWVFTRGSGSWSQIPKIVGFRGDSDQVVANGAIHFNYNSYGRRPEKYILAFDMVDMVEGQLRKIPYPPDDSFHGYLTQFGGRLALRGYYDSEEEYDKLKLWILEDYNNHKWVKQTIHMPFGWMRFNYVLALNLKTGEMLLQSKVSDRGSLDRSRYFLYYNMKTGTFRRVEVNGLPRWIELSDWIQVNDNGPSPRVVVKINFDDEMEAEDRANSAPWTSSFL
ncbi:F-box/LRR-repeat protein At2g40920-like [Corylus avellana]|uniref:F-box/LRR-repeat protein At2g40920-like n=1 Tax=Corylus avellana TaxID=13451 RepID=UPI00286AD8B2|nr:F-box/LRR-repeat protein At2g40920-like [Corylus avellana]